MAQLSCRQPDASNCEGITGWSEVHSFPVDEHTARPLVIEPDRAIADEPGIAVTFEWGKLERHEIK